MKYRAYFKLQITLLSPLSIGNSFNEKSDKDIVLDSRGRPMIPGTSIAGVLRSLAKEQEKDTLFGCIDKDGKTQQDSQLIFYDAKLKKKSHTAIRDCVALDEYKTAKPGAKFDFQAVEPGAVFIGYAEAHSSGAKEALEKLLKNISCLGAKTTRGYGKIEVAYSCRTFDFSKQGEKDEWLEFDMFDSSYENWEEVKPQAAQIRLKLKQRGGLSIRQYRTEASTDKQRSADYIPMALQDGTPVLPGTSWAGMFRHHMESMLTEDELNCLFGYVNENSKKCKKSKIMFSESQIAKYTQKQLTRNMIDRFTNGTKEGALYTELTIYNGETALEIKLNGSICGKIKCALCATIMDLHNGYVAVGGLTAVGRGLFEIVELNGEKFDGKFDTLKKEVLGYF